MEEVTEVDMKRVFFGRTRQNAGNTFTSDGVCGESLNDGKVP